MRRRLVLLAIGLSVACVLLGVSTQAKAGGNGAGVIRDGGGTCLAGDSHGDSWWFSCNLHLVFAPNGVVTQHLTGSVIPTGPDSTASSPLPSQAVTDVAGGPCLVLGGQVVTTVVAGVVTPSGQVQLTCKS